MCIEIDIHTCMHTHINSIQPVNIYSVNNCCFCMIQELGSLEGKPRMGFHHLEKGRAASSSPHSNGETGALEQLSKPGLTGESMYRRRYTQSSQSNVPVIG